MCRSTSADFRAFVNACRRALTDLFTCVGAAGIYTAAPVSLVLSTFLRKTEHRKRRSVLKATQNNALIDWALID